MKRNLQNDFYGNIEQFQEDIEKIKLKFNETIPGFTGKHEIILEVCQQLILKASDFLAISNKKESDVNLRKLKEKNEEMEKEKIVLKQEYT